MGGFGEGHTHIMFLLLKVVNPPYSERGYDDRGYQRRLGCSRHYGKGRERTRDQSASMRASLLNIVRRSSVDHVRYHNSDDVHKPP
jgi:hypothetical protein